METGKHSPAGPSAGDHLIKKKKSFLTEKRKEGELIKTPPAGPSAGDLIKTLPAGPSFLTEKRKEADPPAGPSAGDHLKIKTKSFLTEKRKEADPPAGPSAGDHLKKKKKWFFTEKRKEGELVKTPTEKLLKPKLRDEKEDQLLMEKAISDVLDHFISQSIFEICSVIHRALKFGYYCGVEYIFDVSKTNQEGTVSLSEEGSETPNNAENVELFLSCKKKVAAKNIKFKHYYFPDLAEHSVCANQISGFANTLAYQFGEKDQRLKKNQVYRSKREIVIEMNKLMAEKKKEEMKKANQGIKNKVSKQVGGKQAGARGRSETTNKAGSKKRKKDGKRSVKRKPSAKEIVAMTKILPEKMQEVKKSNHSIKNKVLKQTKQGKKDGKGSVKTTPSAKEIMAIKKFLDEKKMGKMKNAKHSVKNKVLTHAKQGKTFRKEKGKRLSKVKKKLGSEESKDQAQREGSNKGENEAQQHKGSTTQKKSTKRKRASNVTHPTEPAAKKRKETKETNLPSISVTKFIPPVPQNSVSRITQPPVRTVLKLKKGKNSAWKIENSAESKEGKIENSAEFKEGSTIMKKTSNSVSWNPDLDSIITDKKKSSGQPTKSKKKDKKKSSGQPTKSKKKEPEIIKDAPQPKKNSSKKKASAKKKWSSNSDSEEQGIIIHESYRKKDSDDDGDVDYHPSMG